MKKRNSLNGNQLTGGGGKTLAPLTALPSRLRGPLLAAPRLVALLWLAASAGLAVGSCEHPAFSPLDDDVEEQEELTRADSTATDSTAATGFSISIDNPEWEVYMHLTY